MKKDKSEKELDYIFETFDKDFLDENPEVIKNINMIKNKLKQEKRLKKMKRIIE